MVAFIRPMERSWVAIFADPRTPDIGCVIASGQWGYTETLSDVGDQ